MFGLTGLYNTFTSAAAYGWVRGTTWSDDNQNGVRDEPYGITGGEVRLLDAGGAVVASARTGYHDCYASMYLIGPILPGDYSLVFTPPEDYVFTESGRDSHVDPVTGATDPFTVGGGEVVIRDAGLIRVAWLTPGPDAPPMTEPDQDQEEMPEPEQTQDAPPMTEPDQDQEEKPAP